MVYIGVHSPFSMTKSLYYTLSLLITLYCRFIFVFHPLIIIVYFIKATVREFLFFDFFVGFIILYFLFVGFDILYFLFVGFSRFYSNNTVKIQYFEASLAG